MSSSPTYRHSFKSSTLPFISYDIDNLSFVPINNLKKVIIINFPLPFFSIGNIYFIANFLKFKTSPALFNNKGYY
jgi:hypothetical protein